MNVERLLKAWVKSEKDNPQDPEFTKNKKISRIIKTG